MSARFFQQSTPAENQSIKVNDATIRGHATIAEYLTVAGYLTTEGAIKVGSYIQHDNIPAANLIQPTSSTTAIDATTVANPYNFCVNTFNATTAAGGEETFFINMKAGLLNSFGFSSVSVYFYGGVVGTAGIPVLSIVTQESDRVTLVLRNVHAANALNGTIHFRFKHELGLVA
tara:strand:- start:55 stop:576 length:522 start_codon:yes stop_codon:yes gene_type:complete